MALYGRRAEEGEEGGEVHTPLLISGGGSFLKMMIKIYRIRTLLLVPIQQEMDARKHLKSPILPSPLPINLFLDM